MIKKPVKKNQVSKTSKSAAKKTSGKSKGPGSKSVKGKSASKALTQKEKDLRAANLIANSEKKKKTGTRRPKKNVSIDQLVSLVDAVVEGMKERKAKNITVMNLAGIENRVTDYFVVCDADSNIHVNSIADSVEDTVAKLTGEKAYHSEGRQNNEWILVDYINVVAHIFKRETREYYNIEGLWGDADIEHISD